MKRVAIVSLALLAMACCCMTANAGLLSALKGATPCDPVEVCAPAEECEPEACEPVDCCEPCCKPTPLKDLIAKIKAAKCKVECCAPVECCEPVEVCAPACE